MQIVATLVADLDLAAGFPGKTLFRAPYEHAGVALLADTPLDAKNEIAVRAIAAQPEAVLAALAADHAASDRKPARFAHHVPA